MTDLGLTKALNNCKILYILLVQKRGNGKTTIAPLLCLYIAYLSHTKEEEISGFASFLQIKFPHSNLLCSYGYSFDNVV